ncbi:copper amine oxidase N-terminal domain-containing protein [Paenibacillus sp. TRM 82003]|nr:copper amine oxidase N-terminal domain-containing protein [Paenibacillus sp. TRM 82003]
MNTAITWKNRLVLTALAAVVATTALGATSAGAEPGKGKSQRKGEAAVQVKAEAQIDATTVTEAEETADDSKPEAGARGKSEAKAGAKFETKSETKSETKNEAKNEAQGGKKPEGEKSSVTDSVYGGGQTHGLLNAWKTVQGKNAAAKVQAILESRGVTAAELASALEAEGEVEAAVAAQEEAVAETPTDVEAVKQLAKLLTKNGKKGLKAFVNGKQPAFDLPPFVKDGRTLVPFRAIAASLEAEVSFDEATRTVTVVRGDVTVKLTLGSDTAYVNDVAVKLDVAAEAVEGRTVVPLRFLGEALGAKVEYDAATEAIIVTEISAEADAEIDVAAEVE